MGPQDIAEGKDPRQEPVRDVDAPAQSRRQEHWLRAQLLPRETDAHERPRDVVEDDRGGVGFRISELLAVAVYVDEREGRTHAVAADVLGDESARGFVLADHSVHPFVPLAKSEVGISRQALLTAAVRLVVAVQGNGVVHVYAVDVVGRHRLIEGPGHPVGKAARRADAIEFVGSALDVAVLQEDGPVRLGDDPLVVVSGEYLGSASRQIPATYMIVRAPRWRLRATALVIGLRSFSTG